MSLPGRGDCPGDARGREAQGVASRLSGSREGPGDGRKPLPAKNRDFLERLSSLAPGRRPLTEFLELSGDAGDDELRAVRSFLFDVYCKIHQIEPGSEREATIRFKLLQELSRGGSLEEITNLFVGNLHLADSAAAAAPATDADPKPRGLAERARRLIEDGYTERISLGSLAQELSVSKEHLSRIFKKRFGLTVTEKVHQVRIEAAKRLMANGGFSLKQVCYETGYQSYNDFYRNFRKVAGVSPKDYLSSLERAAGE